MARPSLCDLAPAAAVQAFVLVLAGPAAAVPPPANWGAATTDCAAPPVYAIDLLICRDLELAHLNAALAARIAAPGPDVRLAISNGEWYRASRLCAQRADAKACIFDAYLERLRLLGPIVEEAENRGPSPHP